MRKQKDIADGLLDVDYESYLARHDVVYLSPPDQPWEGLPTGNGDMGALLWVPRDGFQVIVNKCDTFDDMSGDNFDAWAKEQEELYTTKRGCGTIEITTGLPVNDSFYLSEFFGRLSLCQAQAHIRSRTPFSSAEVSSIVSDQYKVGVIDYQDELEEELPRRISLSRWGSRVFAHWYAWIKFNPAIGLAGTEVCIEYPYMYITQKMREMDFVFMARLEGAKAQIKRDHSRSVSFYLEPARKASFKVYYTVVTSEESPDMVEEAKDRLNRAVAAGYNKILGNHKEQWGEFWKSSFINLSHDYLENLWYIILYLMANGLCVSNVLYEAQRQSTVLDKGTQEIFLALDTNSVAVSLTVKIM